MDMINYIGKGNKPQIDKAASFARLSGNSLPPDNNRIHHPLDALIRISQVHKTVCKQYPNIGHLETGLSLMEFHNP